MSNMTGPDCTETEGRINILVFVRTAHLGLLGRRWPRVVLGQYCFIDTPRTSYTCHYLLSTILHTNTLIQIQIGRYLDSKDSSNPKLLEFTHTARSAQLEPPQTCA